MDISQYYQQISKEPLLSKDEEVALFEEYYNPNTTEKRKAKIKDRIIRANLRFAFQRAKGYARSSTFPDALEELILAANEGLVVGFEKFKPSANTRFLSYAGWWVSQRILKQMAQVRIVSLPIWKQQLATKIRKMREMNPELTLDQIKAMFPDIKPKDIEDLAGTAYHTFYIADMDEEDPMFEISPIESIADKRIDANKVQSLVENLPDPYKTIITDLYGIGLDDPKSASMIADELGLNKEQFRMLKNEALALLKEQLS